MLGQDTGISTSPFKEKQNNIRKERSSLWVCLLMEFWGGKFDGYSIQPCLPLPFSLALLHVPCFLLKVTALLFRNLKSLSNLKFISTELVKNSCMMTHTSFFLNCCVISALHLIKVSEDTS